MPRHNKKPPGQRKPPLTHFLCLPLVTPESKPQLEASVRRFKDAVAIKDPVASSQIEQDATVVPDVHPKAIRPVGALHCTLGVMSLDQAKLRQAVETLQGLDVAGIVDEAGQHSDERTEHDHSSTEVQPLTDKPEHPPASLERPISPPVVQRTTQATPLMVNLEGLVSMHAPHDTSILYTAPSDTSERLYPFCLAVQKLFADKDFLVPDGRQLKLHATIVNTIYAKGKRQRRAPPKWKRDLRQETPQALDEDDAERGGEDEKPEQDDRSSGHGPNANAPLKIDATAILEHFKDFVWAKNVVLNRIAICEMGAKKILDAEGKVIGEEYKEVASVMLPGRAR